MQVDVGPGDRYLLEEALTLYEFEPSLQDLFLEGRSDVGFFSWYLGHNKLNMNVYAIDDRVEIPSIIVTSLSEDVSARGRAIAFAVHAQRRLGKSQLSVTVVVDADFARITGPIPIESGCLFYTDDCALENYILQERPLDKLLRVVLRSSVPSPTVIAAITPALRELLAVRILLKEFRIRVIDGFIGLCHLSESGTTVDALELIRRSLGGLRREEWPADLGSLESMLHEYRGLVEHSEQTGRGHDIAALICHYLEINGSALRRETVEVSMLGCLESYDLDEWPLFRSLRERGTMSQVTGVDLVK